MDFLKFEWYYIFNTFNMMYFTQTSNYEGMLSSHINLCQCLLVYRLFLLHNLQTLFILLRRELTSDLLSLETTCNIKIPQTCKTEQSMLVLLDILAISYLYMISNNLPHHRQRWVHVHAESLPFFITADYRFNQSFMVHVQHDKTK